MKRAVAAAAICLLVVPAQAATFGEWYAVHRDDLVPASRLCGEDPIYPQLVDTPQCKELHGYLQEMYRLWAIEDAKKKADRKMLNEITIERALELYRSRVPFSEDR